MASVERPRVSVQTCQPGRAELGGRYSNDVSLRSIAQRDSIGSVHEMIFNNQSAAQRDRTML